MKKLLIVIIILLFTISIGYLQVINDYNLTLYLKLLFNINCNKEISFLLRKLFGHFGLNMIFSFILICLMKYKHVNSKKIILLNLIFGLLLSIIFESLQLFTKIRVFSFVDIGINYLGYIFLSFYLFMIRKIIINRFAYK